MIKVLLKNNDVNCQQKAIIVTYELDNRYYLGLSGVINERDGFQVDIKL